MFGRSGAGSGDKEAEGEVLMSFQVASSSLGYDAIAKVQTPRYDAIAEVQMLRACGAAKECNIHVDI